ncbi:hypothetical protein [Myroides odoratimimus]|uniref:hypothetical protein n=1 Tax=Myroides odoratimimus TaxID=76832 RepID=UPI00257817EB|nr:hypothetical protein [Myroides odoratimimus]MDM1521422.1 hypothetical protein [Myroides odoratimimus]
MGLQIGGIVIDKNYQSDLEGLEVILKSKLVHEEEVTFKKATVSDKESDILDICFLEDATLVLVSIGMASLVYKASKQKVMSFVIDEEMMSFNLHYTENGFLIRTVLEVEGEVVESIGEPLEYEEVEESKIELIYHLIEDIIGEYLWDIEPQERCMRFGLKEDKVEDEIFVTSSSIPTFEFEDLGDEEYSSDENKVVNMNEEITKVKRQKKSSIIKQVIKGLGLKN